MTIQFKILGTTGLRINGDFDDTWGKRQERGLLGALLQGAGERRLTRDELARWIWADDSGRRRRNLQQLVSRLKRTLEGIGVPAEVHTSKAGHWVEVDPESVDFHHFRRVTKTAGEVADSGAHLDAICLLEEALGLWAGIPLADLETESARGFRQNVARPAEMEARFLLVDCRLELGQFADALADIDGPMAADGVNPRLVVQRMRALNGLGRATEISGYYMRFAQEYRELVGQDVPEWIRREHDDLLASGSPRLPVASDHPDDDDVSALGDLPSGSWSFYGRAELLDDLNEAARTRPTGVIALDGAAGIGKSALAVHWARQAAGELVDRVLYVDLQGYHGKNPLTEDEIVGTLLSQLGVVAERIPSKDMRVHRLRQKLARRRYLVVFDDAKDSQYVRPLLRFVRECLVLVASRKKLQGLIHLDGARSIEVPPLDAAEVFRWLRAELHSRFLVEPHAAKRLVDLCAGIPLVVRIIAQHASTRSRQSLTSLTEELHADRRVLLRLGGNDDEGATIEAALGCSYRALTPAQQTLFRLLGLYPGREFDSGAAESLTQWEPAEVGQALDALVSLHLVERSSDRYEMHDLVRTCAASWNRDHSTTAAATRRLADYVLWSGLRARETVFPTRSAPPLDGFRPSPWARAFASVEDAFRWAGRNQSELLAAAADARDNGLHGHCWRLANTVWELLRLPGWLDAAKELLTMGLDSAREDDDARAIAGTMGNLGSCLLWMGQRDEARALLQKAILMAGDAEDLAVHHGALQNYARCEADSQNYEGALSVYNEALGIASAAGDRYRVGSTKRRIAEVRRRQGKLDDAAMNCREAIFHHERVGDSQGQADALTELALICKAAGDSTMSREYALRALHLGELMRDKGTCGRAALVVAQSALDEGFFNEGLRYGRIAAEHCEQMRDTAGEIGAVEVVTAVLQCKGRHEAAAEGRRRLRELRADIDPLSA